MWCRPAATALRIAALAGLLAAAARADDEGYARVIVNGVVRGDFRFVRSGETFLFTVADLRAMGFAALPDGAASGPDDWISIRRFFPPVFSELDGRTSTLRLDADPSLLGRSVVDLAPRAHADVLRPADSAALFNYGVHWTRTAGAAQESLAVPGELAVSGGGVAFVSNGALSATDGREAWTRGMTVVTVDEPSHNLRFFAGEALATAGSLGSGLALAGLGVSTQFSMTPALLTRVGLDVSGMLRTTSEVEVYVNDVLVRKERFAPGEFEVRNLPNTGGASDVTIVIRDAFGREQRITDPTYLASQLLAPGIHDLSYAFGVERTDLGGWRLEYGAPVFLGYHRVGLHEGLTGGFRGEASPRVVNGGPIATFRIGPLGELDLAAAYSRQGASDGLGASAAWTYSARRFSVGLSARSFSRTFARLTLEPDADKPRFDGTISLGLRAGRAGSIGVSYSQRRPYVADDLARGAVHYQRTLGRSLALGLSGGFTFAGRTSWDARASLTWRLWGRSIAGFGATGGSAATSASATLQRGASLGPGFGYRLGGTTTDRGSTAPRSSRGDAFLEYHAGFANLSADLRWTDTSTTWSASATGAVALIDESLHLSRPIRDGFALVKVGGLRGVPVRVNHQPAGATGTGGVLILPALTSYYDALISVDDAALPVDYQLKRPSRRVAVGFRGGGIVPFELRRLRAFSGRLVIVEEGRRLLPEFWGLEILAGDQTVTAIVGHGGEFYVEDLDAGLHAARLFSKERECHFVIRIPASEEPWVDLGLLRCDVPGGGT